MKRIAAILLVLTFAHASGAFAQLDKVAPANAAPNSVTSSQSSVPSSWREIVALDGVLAFRAPRNILIVPSFNDKYAGCEFRAEGLRITFWFESDSSLGGEGMVIDGRSAQINVWPDLVAAYFPDIARPKPGGVGETKGLRLNVSHQGKPDEAAAIVRSIRFSAAGSAVEKAAQAQAASFRAWKHVAAGDILSFNAPPSLQPRDSAASDGTRHRFRATGFELEIESRKIASPPAEYAGKEIGRSRFRIDEYWVEVLVKPGRMLAYFRKSLSANTYEGPVLEFRFDDFEAQENAVALLRTMRLQPLAASRASREAPVPLLGGASAEEQLFFAIAFTAVDEVMTTRGAEGATVKYEGNAAVVTFPFFPPDVPKGTVVTGPDFSAQVWIDRASGTIMYRLVGS